MGSLGPAPEVTLEDTLAAFEHLDPPSTPLTAVEVAHDDDLPRVEIDAEGRDDEWLFRAPDDGIGIDPARRSGTFEASNRLHTREAYPGTGIGPARCRQIADRHGGRIWAETETGTGSTVYVALPVGAAPPGRKARPSRPLEDAHEHP